MYKNLWNKAFESSKLLTIGLAMTCPSLAETADTKSRRLVIEEVMVTAQKREQSIRDVPISLLAIDAEFMAEKGITDFSELANFVPNVKMRTDNGAGINMNIRGFAKQSGNTAFDQAVGLLVDGVPYNDNDFFTTGMIDIARIEVLRGPQGTLLGKNTTAGLINITTRRPGDEYSGYVDMQGGDYDHKRVEAAFGGPLINSLINFRVALLSDKRDGVFTNTTADIEEDPRSFFPGNRKDLLTRDRESIRLKLEMPDFLGSLWGVQFEYAEVGSIGNATEIAHMDDELVNYLRQFDPNLNTTPFDFIGSTNDPGFNDRTVKKAVFYNESAFGDWGLDTTLAWAHVGGYVATGDPTPAPLFGASIATDKPQWNLDIVLTSPMLFDGALEFTTGLFFEDRLLKTESLLEIADEPFAGAIAAEAGNSVVPPTVILPPSLSGVLDPFTVESSTIEFEQNAKTAALYGQFDWHFAEQFTLTTGFRVSQEKKDAEWDRVFNSVNTVLLEEVLGYEEFTNAMERSETTVQPKVALNYKPTDDISLFVHWARGYRSGGFNQAGSRNAGLTYDRETVDEYAFNAKTRLLDGAFEFNIGWFLMKLTDFQLLTTGPNDIAPVAENAGSAEAEGVEMDFRWLASHWFSVSTAVGYNNARFTDFPFGPCPADRPNFDGDEDERCNLTGFALQNSPLWSVSISPSLRWQLSDLGIHSDWLQGVELMLAATAEYQTEATTGLPGDDRFVQDEYVRYDLSVGLGADAWSLRVSGKNVTDEAIQRVTAHIPGTQAIVQSLEPPRTVYAQFRWNL